MPLSATKLGFADVGYAVGAAIRLGRYRKPAVEQIGLLMQGTEPHRLQAQPVLMALDPARRRVGRENGGMPDAQRSAEVFGILDLVFSDQGDPPRHQQGDDQEREAHADKGLDPSVQRKLLGLNGGTPHGRAVTCRGRCWGCCWAVGCRNTCRYFLLRRLVWLVCWSERQPGHTDQIAAIKCQQRRARRHWERLAVRCEFV